MRTIHLPDVPLGAVAAAAEAARAQGRGLRLKDTDLARFAVVLSRVTGSVLDVGFGAGVFLDAVLSSGRACEGVERQLPSWRSGWRPVAFDAAHLPYGDRRWETVTALEVLEHQPDDKVHDVLAELRRVSRHKLILTVPLCEPWPPATQGHLQRFCPDRLAALFPRAQLTKLDKGSGRYPWVMVEEVR